MTVSVSRPERASVLPAQPAPRSVLTPRPPWKAITGRTCRESTEQLSAGAAVSPGLRAGRDRAPGSTWTRWEVGRLPIPWSLRRGLRPGPESGSGSGKRGPRRPHLLPLALLQRPHRRVVEPEQQEAGPGSGGEAEPELPTQKLLGSRHGREVEGKHNSSHTRPPPPATFALQGARLAQPVSPGRSRPAGTPPTAGATPQLRQSCGRCLLSGLPP